MKLIKKIKKKESIIAVLGLGYVGLPLCAKLSQRGFKVKGIDINQKKIENLKKYQSKIINFKNKKIKKFIIKNTKFFSNYEIISQVDVIIICVPTPIKKNKKPEMKYISDVTKKIIPFLKKNQLIIMESTVYPGATEEYFLPVFKKKNLTPGKDIFLGFSPEREDPGNPKYSITKGNIPKIVSGYSEKCLKLTKQLYENVSTVVSVSSIKTAEFTKLLENVYRSVNIGFVNEMKIIAHSMGLDINETIEAAKTKPFGFSAFYPGPGLGGHCIPIDPYLLSWQANNFGTKARFIKLSGAINESMCGFVFNRLLTALKDKKEKITGEKILILGMAYKKDSSDLRESPSFKIIELLKKKNFIVHCSDPMIKNINEIDEVEKIDNLKLIKINKFNIKKYAAVILITNHQRFNYKLIEKYAKIIIDTRNSFNSALKKVYKA